MATVGFKGLIYRYSAALAERGGPRGLESADRLLQMLSSVMVTLETPDQSTDLPRRGLHSGDVCGLLCPSGRLRTCACPSDGHRVDCITRRVASESVSAPLLLDCDAVGNCSSLSCEFMTEQGR